MNVANVCNYLKCISNDKDVGQFIHFALQASECFKDKKTHNNVTQYNLIKQIFVFKTYYLRIFRFNNANMLGLKSYLSYEYSFIRAF